MDFDHREIFIISSIIVVIVIIVVVVGDDVDTAHSEKLTITFWYVLVLKCDNC